MSLWMLRPREGVGHHIPLPLISVTLKLIQHLAASLSSHLPLKSLNKDGCRLQLFQLPGAGPSQAAFPLLLACFLCRGRGGGGVGGGVGVLKSLFQAGQHQSFSLLQVLDIRARMT